MNFFLSRYYAKKFAEFFKSMQINHGYAFLSLTGLVAFFFLVATFVAWE